MRSGVAMRKQKLRKQKPTVKSRNHRTKKSPALENGVRRAHHLIAKRKTPAKKLHLKLTPVQFFGGRFFSPLLVKVDGHHFRNAALFHRHAVQSRRDFHRELVVRDNDDLRALCHLFNEIVKAINVRIVERSIDLI